MDTTTGRMLSIKGTWLSTDYSFATGTHSATTATQGQPHCCLNYPRRLTQQAHVQGFTCDIQRRE